MVVAFALAACLCQLEIFVFITEDIQSGIQLPGESAIDVQGTMLTQVP